MSLSKRILVFCFLIVKKCNNGSTTDDKEMTNLQELHRSYRLESAINDKHSTAQFIIIYSLLLPSRKKHAAARQIPSCLLMRPGRRAAVKQAEGSFFCQFDYPFIS
jgi:hypothetical protein